ncbi:MAG: hypothetical protein ACJAU6_003243 [Alphaproteobacteria bacterium]|jgi:hypothetical protein
MANSPLSMIATIFTRLNLNNILLRLNKGAAK